MQGLFFYVNYWWLYIKALINICNQCSGNNVCVCVIAVLEQKRCEQEVLNSQLTCGTARNQGVNFSKAGKWCRFIQCQKSAKVKQKNTASQQALASQMPAFSFLPH